MRSFVKPSWLLLMMGVVLAGSEHGASLSEAFFLLQNWRPLNSASMPVEKNGSSQGHNELILRGDAEAQSVGWDVAIHQDLSEYSAISLEIEVSNSKNISNLGLYWGSGTGWYALFRSYLEEGKQTLYCFLADFGQEQQPSSWKDITRFRLRAWCAGPGPIVIRILGVRMERKRTEENLVKNGSFEILDSALPFAWGDGQWGLGEDFWVANPDLWRHRWYVARDGAKFGTNCLCLDQKDGEPTLRAVSTWIHLPSGPIYSLILWLKSEALGQKILVSCGAQKTVYTLDASWKPYRLDGIKGGDFTQRVAIIPQTSGRFYIDGVRLGVTGETFDKYVPNERDNLISEREKSVDFSFPAGTSIKTTAGAMPLNGKHAVIWGMDGTLRSDGSQYVPFAMGFDGLPSNTVLQTMATKGFDALYIMIRPETPEKDLLYVMDQCELLGLHVIIWFFSDWPVELTKKTVESIRDKDSLLAWQVMDEPSQTQLAEARRRVALVKMLDPRHPVYVNYLPVFAWARIGDLYSTDIYPIPDSPPIAATRVAQRLAEFARVEGKPCWMWVQATGFSYMLDREPTARELSCIVYGSLIAGVRGFLFFHQLPHTESCFIEMIALKNEVEMLAPMLDGDHDIKANCDDSTILYLALRKGSQIWLLATNTSAVKKEVTFGMDNGFTSVDVLFENRSMVMDGGKLKDAFGPYERHVYLVH